MWWGEAFGGLFSVCVLVLFFFQVHVLVVCAFVVSLGRVERPVHTTFPDFYSRRLFLFLTVLKQATCNRNSTRSLRGNQVATKLRLNQPDSGPSLSSPPQITIVDSEGAVDEACADGMTVKAADAESGCSVGVSLAPGEKCERCWYQCESVGSHHDHPSLCSRCHGVVEELGIPPPLAVVAEEVTAPAPAA